MTPDLKPQFFMIRALPEPNAQECLNSFCESTDFNYSDVKIIDEMEMRENTLNYILKVREKDRDLFVFVDDIRFKHGWWRALNDATGDGHIVGFSMTDAKTGLLQDFGYDFITIDHQVTYRGLHKHCTPESLDLPSHRECSSVCGCAMWINKNVFDYVSEFPLDGQNRWGEMLFSVKAKEHGFKTVVVSSHLDHYGTSTKMKADAKLSSLSWLIERDLWSRVASVHLNEVEFMENIKRMVSRRLLELIDNSNRVVIYGSGTIADFIGKSLPKESLHVVAGLAEEVGQKFLGVSIQDVRDFEFRTNDLLLVTPIGYRDNIEPLLADCKAPIFWISSKRHSDTIMYDIG